MAITLLIMTRFTQSWTHYKAVKELFKQLPSDLIFNFVPNSHNLSSHYSQILGTFELGFVAKWDIFYWILHH